MSKFQEHLDRWNQTADSPQAYVITTASLWSGLWLILGIRFGFLWDLEHWNDGPLSTSQCLLITLPLVSGWILLPSTLRSAILNRVFLACFAFLLFATYLLGSFQGIVSSAWVSAFVFCVALLKSLQFISDNDSANGTSINSESAAINQVSEEPSQVEFDDESLVAGRQNDLAGPPPVAQNPASDHDIIDDLEDEELGEAESQDDWIQQLTRRQLPSQDAPATHQVEWFGRHQWRDQQNVVEMHVIFQPAFAETPEIQIELVEGDARVKIADQQNYGVRLELKCNKDGNSIPALIWLSATGRVAD